MLSSTVNFVVSLQISTHFLVNNLGYLGIPMEPLCPKTKLNFTQSQFWKFQLMTRDVQLGLYFFSFIAIAFKLPSYYVHIYYIHTILCLQLLIKYCLILALSLCIPSFYPFILPFKFPESIYNYLSHCPFLV